MFFENFEVWNFYIPIELFALQLKKRQEKMSPLESI